MPKPSNHNEFYNVPECYVNVDTFRWALAPMTCTEVIQPDSVNYPRIRQFSLRSEHIQLAMSAGLVQFLCRAEFHARQKCRRCDFEEIQRQGPVQGPAQAASDSTSDRTCSGWLH